MIHPVHSRQTMCAHTGRWASLATTGGGVALYVFDKMGRIGVGLKQDKGTME